MGDGSPFKIEAVVRFNSSEAYVLNRKPQFRFERHGDDLIGADGPFRRTYRYERPHGRFKAFAGAEFDIPMMDGTVTKASGQWWHTGSDGAVSVTYNTKAELLRCYVFTGAEIDPVALAELRAAHTSPDVYPYYAYHAVIHLPVEREKNFLKTRKLERDKAAAISQARAWKKRAAGSAP